MKKTLLVFVALFGLCGPALAQQNVHVSKSTPEGTSALSACATDTGTCTIIELLKRIAQNLTTINATAGTSAALVPVTTGGLTFYVLQPAASDNHANVKGTAGQVYALQAFNNSSTINYIRLYNSASFNGCNSATNLQWQGMIPANSTNGAGLTVFWDTGLSFAAGIGICVTSGFGQTDTTNATASAISVNIAYK